MQKARRRDPVPWTWEIPFAITVAVLVVLSLGAQLGRAIANLLSGDGWTWAPRAELFSSLPGVLGGHADSGLTGAGHVAGAHLLWTCVTVVELGLIVAASWGVKVGMDRWGPNRLRGMASRAEAEELLGRSHLREVAPVVRPDLYGKKSSR